MLQWRMAESPKGEELLVRGQRCIEQMCGRRHDIAERYWHRYEDILSLDCWLTLPPPKPRAYVRLSFPVQEITACVTDPQVRACLRRRIDAALTRVVSPREAPDDA